MPSPGTSHSGQLLKLPGTQQRDSRDSILVSGFDSVTVARPGGITGTQPAAFAAAPGAVTAVSGLDA